MLARLGEASAPSARWRARSRSSPPAAELAGRRSRYRKRSLAPCVGRGDGFLAWYHERRKRERGRATHARRRIEARRDDRVRESPACGVRSVSPAEEQQPRARARARAGGAGRTSCLPLLVIM